MTEPAAIRSSIESWSTSVKTLNWGKSVVGGQAGDHGVADVADAALQREELGRDPARRHLVEQEPRDVGGDPPAHLVGRGEAPAAVGLVGMNDARPPSRGSTSAYRLPIRSSGSWIWIGWRCGGGGRTMMSAISRSRGE